MNKYLLASLTGIAVLAIATPAFAYKGDPSIQGPNYSPERHEAMQVVFETGDYEGWLKLMEGKAMRLKQDVDSKEKFQEFAKAHQGGAETLSEFRSQHNLGTGGGMGKGHGRNR